MDWVPILAQAAEAPATRTAGEAIVPMELIWEHIISLNLVEAVTFMSFGVVCLFYGWRVFKVLVVISFALVGLVAGSMLSEVIIGTSNPLLVLLLGIVTAIASVPLMRWAVSLLGAVAGAILTAALWYAFSLPEQYIWAGGLVGFVGGGMISFIVFKISVMLFSSLGGSMLMVSGTLALLYTYQQTTEAVERLVFTESWFLPLVLLVPTAVGVLMQNRLVRSSPNYSI